MRFLHTSDWHVGKNLVVSRLAEHKAVLAEILDIAVRERVDCILISGDMFHSRSPHPDDEQLVFGFFAELARRKIPAVVICGNHDHPRRLAALRGLLSPLGIHVCPEPARPDDGGIVPITARGERALIAALPHVSARYVVDSWQLLDPERDWYKDYAERVAGMIEVLARRFTAATVNILLGHMFLNGADASGSEWTVHVGLPYAVPPARLPAAAQYVAVGHLHRPQDVTGAPVPTRYAGSPLQLDFGERDQRKSVTIVDAVAGRPAQLDIIPLTSGRALRDVEGTLDELTARADEFGTDFLRVTVAVAQPVPGLADQVRGILPNALIIRPKLPVSLDASPLQDRRGVSPEQQFSDWFQRFNNSVTPSEALLNAFRQLREEATHAAD
jgi:DNA repair protein SbcD/Mre11